jgi:hypothetical protein
MQSTDLEEIKAALWEQAYHPCTRVSWGMAQVMAVRRSKGYLLVQLRGRSRMGTTPSTQPASPLFENAASTSVLPLWFIKGRVKPCA